MNSAVVHLALDGIILSPPSVFALSPISLTLKDNSSFMGFPGGLVVKNLPANGVDARDAVSIPGSGRSPGGGNGNPLQYSCLENPMDGGAWRATVYAVAKSQA